MNLINCPQSLGGVIAYPHGAVVVSMLLWHPLRIHAQWKRALNDCMQSCLRSQLCRCSRHSMAWWLSPFSQCTRMARIHCGMSLAIQVYYQALQLLTEHTPQAVLVMSLNVDLQLHPSSRCNRCTTHPVRTDLMLAAFMKTCDSQELRWSSRAIGVPPASGDNAAR